MRRAGPALVAVLTLTAAFAGAGAAPARAGSAAFRFAATVFRGGGGEPNVSISPDGRTVLVDGLAAFVRLVS